MTKNKNLLSGGLARGTSNKQAKWEKGLSQKNWVPEPFPVFPLEDEIQNMPLEILNPTEYYILFLMFFFFNFKIVPIL